VKEITGEIFNRVKKIAGKYEGFIDPLLGDGALVLFGVPKAHEDDAARAVQYVSGIQSAGDATGGLTAEGLPEAFSQCLPALTISTVITGSTSPISPAVIIRSPNSPY
jgi:hypothetical protein